MNEALDDVLRDTVSDARLTVAELVKRLAAIDAKQARALHNERA
jgi:hypothetical protein